MRESKPDGVIAHDGWIEIAVNDQGAAFDLARAFGREDGFYDEVMAAAMKAWPTEQADGEA